MAHYTAQSKFLQVVKNAIIDNGTQIQGDGSILFEITTVEDRLNCSYLKVMRAVGIYGPKMELNIAT